MVQKKERTEKYEEALRLRKRGFTYREIAQMVGVSKGTISNWFSRETWSDEVKKQNTKRASNENSKRLSLLNKARANQLKKLYVEVERSAHIEYTHYKKDLLFIAGLSLYMAQGDMKSTQYIRISSAKMEIHRMVCEFSAFYLGVPREKIRFWLILYPTHDPLACTRAWSKYLDIPIRKFGKYQIINGKGTKEQLRFGVGNTIIGNTVLKHKLSIWIDRMQKDLIA